MLKVRLIYDNTVFKKGLEADWGFSALVEFNDSPKILFDTGANGKILLDNMEKLAIDPMSIDEVFISHGHFDHTGGLSEFLQVNKEIDKIYIPPSFHGLKDSRAVKITESMKIHENIFSTGELAGIEQALAVKTAKGVVLIVGCSHPKMSLILNTASRFGRVYGIIGGLHGFYEFELFKDLQLICPTHCTQHKKEIKELYPDRYVEGGAGQVIEI